ncbi:hypothetical protein [Streptomyces sp. NBC_01601]|uniref:hypothetical protein n=1 Tax=Streptomyces sp. NBC_01601 TaxID=2975892 RepID=UPI002E2C2BD3|nr:hypothetical protein [Streptomyces sp. NBC_01601]
MASKSQDTGSKWTPEQRTGQAGLNAALNAARQAPVQGKEVPANARRSGRMDA